MKIRIITFVSTVKGSELRRVSQRYPGAIYQQYIYRYRYFNQPLYQLYQNVNVLILVSSKFVLPVSLGTHRRDTGKSVCLFLTGLDSF
jgi:hypothetical protein